MRHFRFFIAMAVLSASPAVAQTYLYQATCEYSTLKQGDQQQDLTKQTGEPFECSGLTISLLGNGHVLVQFANKKGLSNILGFGGDGLDYESNPNFITIPLRRIYLPHTNNPGKPEVVEGIEGFCFIDGKANIRSLETVDCVAKMELGSQRLVYNIKSTVQGIGQLVH